MDMVSSSELIDRLVIRLREKPIKEWSPATGRYDYFFRAYNWSRVEGPIIPSMPQARTLEFQTRYDFTRYTTSLDSFSVCLEKGTSIHYPSIPDPIAYLLTVKEGDSLVLSVASEKSEKKARKVYEPEIPRDRRVGQLYESVDASYQAYEKRRIAAEKGGRTSRLAKLLE